MVINVSEVDFASVYTGPSDNGSSRSRPNHVFWPIRLHGSITEKTTISNLNIVHFSFNLPIFYKNLCTQFRQYIALPCYIILWSQQKSITGNVIKNSKVYCLISVCSCFVIILKTYLVQLEGGCGSGMAVGCFTQVMLHSAKRYHQVYVSAMLVTGNNIVAALGAVMTVFHGINWVSLLFTCREEGNSL
jgi:hypothetical protein